MSVGILAYFQSVRGKDKIPDHRKGLNLAWSLAQTGSGGNQMPGAHMGRRLGLEVLNELISSEESKRELQTEVQDSLSRRLPKTPRLRAVLETPSIWQNRNGIRPDGLTQHAGRLMV